ncbi:unnamed protein product, partial [Meganyctiphanes norvegica]
DALRSRQDSCRIIQVQTRFKACSVPFNMMFSLQVIRSDGCIAKLLLLILLLFVMPSYGVETEYNRQRRALLLKKDLHQALGKEKYKVDPKFMRYNTTRTLRVAVEEWSPHILVTEVDGNITIKGPMANLLFSLTKAINFKYTLVRPLDGAWGAPDSTGRWNGMIGMVKRN